MVERLGKPQRRTQCNEPRALKEGSPGLLIGGKQLIPESCDSTEHTDQTDQPRRNENVGLDVVMRVLRNLLRPLYSNQFWHNHLIR